MDTDKYLKLKEKYKYHDPTMLSLPLDFIRLRLLLPVLKLAEEDPEMIDAIPDIQEEIDRLRKRVIAATGLLGLSVDQIELLKTKFM